MEVQKILENLVQLVETHTDSWERKDYGCVECTGPEDVLGDGKYQCALHAAKGWLAARPSPINFNIDHPLVDDTEVIKASQDAVIRNNWGEK